MFMFIPAYLLRTDKLTDISYALSFVVVALFGYLQSDGSVYALILLLMICLWAARLGGYLLVRIRKINKDTRFEQMRGNFWRFGGFWLLQGFTVWAVLVPASLFFGNTVAEVRGITFVGVGVWLLGLLIEAVADLQKYRFIQNPQNRGMWIASGLWKYSRHPNYFGEILLWVGVYFYAVSSLAPAQALVAIVGPMYITLLIVFISGIPLLEKGADAKWGNNPKYRQYKNKTSILLPLPVKK